MFTTIITNLFTGLAAVSLSGSVALHDSRFDKVFAMTATPNSDVSVHDLTQAVSHELHVHDFNSVAHADPGTKARSHRKHTDVHLGRIKSAELTA